MAAGPRRCPAWPHLQQPTLDSVDLALSGTSAKSVSETELSDGGLQRPENALKMHLGQMKFRKSLDPVVLLMGWRKVAPRVTCISDVSFSGDVCDRRRERAMP